MRSSCFVLTLLVAAVVLAACANPGWPRVQATETTIIPATPQSEAPTRDASPTTVPTETPHATQALSGTIAYSYEGDIYTMRTDGSGITRLTTDPAMDFDPSWSPDGKYIAFRSHRDGDEEVYRMQADGSNQQNLSNAPSGDYSPAWSPDGQWIAFMSNRAGNANVWVMRPDGTDPRQVTDLPGISEYPTWSPDSRRIAFHCTFGRVLPGGTGDFEICVVNADGTELTQLTDAPGSSKLPAWSPDGAFIAFQTDRNGWPTLPDYTPPGYDPEDFGDTEIFLMGSDGANPVNITNNPREGDEFPAWSRDGYLIISRRGGCLVVINTDGSPVAQFSQGLCAGNDSGHFADWHQPAR